MRAAPRRAGQCARGKQHGDVHGKRDDAHVQVLDRLRQAWKKRGEGVCVKFRGRMRSTQAALWANYQSHRDEVPPEVWRDLSFVGASRAYWLVEPVPVVPVPVVPVPVVPRVPLEDEGWLEPLMLTPSLLAVC